MRSLPLDGITSYHAIYIDWVHAIPTTLCPRGEKHLDMSGLNLVEQNNTHHKPQGLYVIQWSVLNNIKITTAPTATAYIGHKRQQAPKLKMVIKVLSIFYIRPHQSADVVSK